MWFRLSKAISQHRHLCFLALPACISLIVAFGGSPLSAQHCPPIEESYLSHVSMVRVPEEKTLELALEYRKLGRLHDAYQVYLLAFFGRDAERLTDAPAGEAFNPEACVVLHTGLLQFERTEANRLVDAQAYRCQIKLDIQELAERMIAFGELAEEDQVVVGGWGYVREPIQLAVFIPFLEDNKYANLEGLPDDRHECNYGNEPALLFAVLPHQLQIKFGVVSAFRMEEGRYQIHINSGRTPGAWKK